MLSFKPIQTTDFPLLKPYFQASPGRLCDTTPGSTFIWRDLYQVEYAIYNGSLYFKAVAPDVGITFPLPLGADRQEHYRVIAQYCCAHGIPLSFYPVAKQELEMLQSQFPNSAAISLRDNADYLYRAEDLKYFRGKKLSGQRNHVNKFLKSYSNWSFRPITADLISPIQEFLDRYAARYTKAAPSFHEDIAKTREILEHFSMYGLLGGALLVENQVVGFSLGEVLGDTLFTHIEKADREYDGCYQMLVAQFAQYYAVQGVDFINREDDTGDPGLRTSKLSYHPIALLEKFSVTVEEPCAHCE